MYLPKSLEHFLDTKQRTISYSCNSDIGLLRKTNQDNLVCNGTYRRIDSLKERFSLIGTAPLSGFHLFGIFDGMGGEECGEIASFLAAEEAASLAISASPENELRDLCLRSNRKICGYAETHGIFAMGTTAAMLAFVGQKLWLCNIGDSKVLHFDHHRLKQISVDHLVPAPFGRKRPLSQNLGIPEEIMIIEPQIAPVSYSDGDIFILCSDGLTDMVSLEEMWSVITGSGIQDLADKLTERALRNGGKDNITVIVIKAESETTEFVQGESDR